MKKLTLFLLITFSINYANAQCIILSQMSDTTLIANADSCSVVYNYEIPKAFYDCSPLFSDVFNYTGSLQYFEVPANVDYLRITVRGAQGGSVTTTCPATGGLGAEMIGFFPVSLGDSLVILVGQQGLTNGSDAGGGGGSFVVTPTNIPLIVAGGGGGATNNINNCGSNRDGLNASITTDGTASGNGLVAGGTNGNGGGASTGSGGGGGGFFTDGVAGSGLANNNGKSFLNGGIGGTGNNNDFGGYGGGGAGWFTGGNGGGGGGYSGGGTSGSQPFTGGGGGGSYNSGLFQNNTAGVQTGNGQVIVEYTPVTVTMIQGLPSGSSFPVGTTTVTFVASDGIGNFDTLSFDVTVIDTVAPTITCPTDVNTCSSVVTGLLPTVNDLCSSMLSFTYNLTGVTTGSGNGDASGTNFNTGLTTVTYNTVDGSGNNAECSFNVTVVDCSGIEEVSDLSNVRIYPNPTQGIVNIQLNQSYTNVIVSLSDITGKQVRKINFGTTELITFNINDLNAGIYLVSIQSENQLRTLRLIKH